MKINCGFARRKENERKYEFRNVVNIEINMPYTKDNGPEIRKELMKYKPDGDGWCITGYAIIEL